MGFYVRPSKLHKYSVIQETWMPERKVQVVPRQAYVTLGFSPEMSLTEARARAAQINKQNQLESKQKANAARRLKLASDTESAYLPDDLVSGFEQSLAELYADNPSRLNNVKKQWDIVKKMLAELSLDPKDFYHSQAKIYNYARTRPKPWAPDYIKKLVRIVNLWGHFVSRKRNSHFQALPKLTSIQVNNLHDIRENVKGVKRAAEPLSYSDLLDAKHRFESDGLELQWNWLFISLWFGLRPKETDSLHNERMWKVERDRGAKIDVLSVYQTKLTSLSKDKRWKVIPVFCEEQKEALKLIKSGKFKRPLNKTIRRLVGDTIETYSPRKGFTDLMLEKGFGLEDISTFLGHNSIDMTWKHYKSKKKFNLPTG